MSDQWRPIETAPRNGEWVRLLCGEGTEDIGQWRDTRYCMAGSPQGSCGEGWVDHYNCLPIMAEFEPTHWMPAPLGAKP